MLLVRSPVHEGRILEASGCGTGPAPAPGVRSPRPGRLESRFGVSLLGGERPRLRSVRPVLRRGRPSGLDSASGEGRTPSDPEGRKPPPGPGPGPGDPAANKRGGPWDRNRRVGRRATGMFYKVELAPGVPLPSPNPSLGPTGPRGRGRMPCHPRPERVSAEGKGIQHTKRGEAAPYGIPHSVASRHRRCAGSPSPPR